jgi:hypothetical protein
VNPQKCLLNDLASVLLVAKQTERDRKRAPLVALHQPFEGELVAILGAFDEDTIFFRFELSARSV